MLVIFFSLMIGVQGEKKQMILKQLTAATAATTQQKWRQRKLQLTP
jgi:hypothetical protein